MAKKFVKISLASKLRLLFGAALLGIIAAALAVPWYSMELLAEQGVHGSGTELLRLSMNEFSQQHVSSHAKAGDALASLARLHSGGTDGRQGPSFISLLPAAGSPPVGAPKASMDAPRSRAERTFKRNADADVSIEKWEDKQGRTMYRCIRAVRAETSCLSCHSKDNEDVRLQFQPGQFVGLIDVSLPASAAASPLVWWTRAAFIVGGVIAASLAFVLFTVITQRLILRPVRSLRELADKVAEGDQSVRSSVKTGDELQHLGDSFNEMLTAITDQHEKLRSANRALDLKLNELAEANVTLFNANKVKNEFLANVSHELRTPLNSIIGFADLISESEDERLKRYGQNIVSSAKGLLNMINDILDLAKIEAGRSEVRFDKVNITDACETLAALMRPLADKKQLDLRVELATDMPLIVTDGGKVQQILFNLLSNAIKFTPPGGLVTLTTTRRPMQRQGEDIDEISIAVIDTGPGIAEADQQHIFEKFHRLDQGLTKESSGTGLGLAISKELASIIGGRITVESTVGHGATFALVVPSQPKPEAAAEPQK